MHWHYGPYDSLVVKPDTTFALTIINDSSISTPIPGVDIAYLGGADSDVLLFYNTYYDAGPNVLSYPCKVYYFPATDSISIKYDPSYPFGIAYQFHNP
ncbi:hypothetical protein GCM10023093_24330 [Nemorincola caseinilytica]|uniref:Plastocyanin-like domain-containing protein n=1 Tax=Nemorincola caseinilytica TaxID=2054315 RepID=A0ABP8NML2_9BACT